MGAKTLPERLVPVKSSGTVNGLVQEHGNEVIMNGKRLCVLAAVLCLASLGLGPATAESRPNIILCMTDDQGWGDTSDVLMDAALDWIGKQAAAKKPFLALIWFPSPHGPHQATPEYAAPYAKSRKQAGYLGELAGVDHAMGTLRAALREMKIADDTMLWFCSDNGAAAPGSTGGLPGGKKWLTEGGTRVPGILEWPARIKKPFATTVPACTMDFYPTTLDVLGIKTASEAGPIDGISLLPLIDGKMAKRPKPIPLVSGMNFRLVDNEYRFQKGRLFRFDEEQKKDVDVTDEKLDDYRRLAEVNKQFLDSVKKDQAAYAFKKPAKGAETK